MVDDVSAWKNRKFSCFLFLDTETHTSATHPFIHSHTHRINFLCADRGKIVMLCFQMVNN